MRPDTIALYALGALADDKSKRFEAHLSCCRECRRKLSDETAFRLTMLAYIRTQIVTKVRGKTGHQE